MLLIQSQALRVLIGAVGALGLIMFLLPLVVSGILNLGNGFGMVSSLCVLLFAWMNPQISCFLTRLCSHKAGKAAFGAFSALLIAGVLLCAVITGFMLHKIYHHPEHEPQAMIVLGCKVYGDRPSRMLRHRLEAAYDYLCEHPDAVAVVSGGQGADEEMTEALCMYRYLTERGISPDRILMEDQSTSTEENFLFSAALLEERGISADRLAVATDGYHQLRASMLAKERGIETTAVSAKTELWLLPTYWVREWFGVIYTIIK